MEAGRDERYCERRAAGTIATRAREFKGYDGARELLLQQRARERSKVCVSGAAGESAHGGVATWQ